MINHAAEGWDSPDLFDGICPGTMVQFQIGLPSVRAEVLGMNLDKTEYILMLRYMHWDDNGEWTQERRIYQRDRQLIEGLYKDYWGICSIHYHTVRRVD